MTNYLEFVRQVYLFLYHKCCFFKASNPYLSNEHLNNLLFHDGTLV